MKLDNRPRKILIQGVPGNDEAVQLVRNHFQVGFVDLIYATGPHILGIIRTWGI